MASDPSGSPSKPLQALVENDYSILQVFNLEVSLGLPSHILLCDVTSLIVELLAARNTDQHFGILTGKVHL